MKLILGFLLIVFFTIIQPKFEGFGLYKLGSPVNELSNFSEFQKYRMDTYVVANCLLSQNIGHVANLYIYVRDSKIYQVSFTAEEYTNITEIEEIIKSFKPSELNEFTSPDYQMFYSPDDRYVITKVIMPDKTVDYSYFIQNVPRDSKTKEND